MATLSQPSHLARTSKGRGPPVTLKMHRSLAQHTHTEESVLLWEALQTQAPMSWLNGREDKQISASVQSLSLPILAYFCICLISQSTWIFNLAYDCVNQHRKKLKTGNSLEVQYLGLLMFTAKVRSLVEELGSSMPCDKKEKVQETISEGWLWKVGLSLTLVFLTNHWFMTNTYWFHRTKCIRNHLPFSLE